MQQTPFWWHSWSQTDENSVSGSRPSAASLLLKPEEIDAQAYYREKETQMEIQGLNFAKDLRTQALLKSCFQHLNSQLSSWHFSTTATSTGSLLPSWHHSFAIKLPKCTMLCFCICVLASVAWPWPGNPNNNSLCWSTSDSLSVLEGIMLTSLCPDFSSFEITMIYSHTEAMMWLESANNYFSVAPLWKPEEPLLQEFRCWPLLISSQKRLLIWFVLIFKLRS